MALVTAADDGGKGSGWHPSCALRRYYIPRVVLREVRISLTEVLREVDDGQQRITTVQRFFVGQLRLPESLRDLDTGHTAGDEKLLTASCSSWNVSKTVSSLVIARRAGIRLVRLSNLRLPPARLTVV